jgi:hypothetical protein
MAQNNNTNSNGIKGPVGFGKIKDKTTARVAAREWVQNTTSGNAKADAKAFDALMKIAGFPNVKNPFVKKIKPIVVKTKPKRQAY